jgi:quercetin dioxygenase-like cupin family protein
MNRQKQSQSSGIQRKQPKDKKLIFNPLDKATFKEVAPGASMAVLWGDEETGPCGAVTKFKPGFDAGMHTHTNDARIVVIKGAYLYRDAETERRVGPGDYLYIPGGAKHWSGGDPEEGALFFNETDGPFDLIPIQ